MEKNDTARYRPCVTMLALAALAACGEQPAQRDEPSAPEGLALVGAPVEGAQNAGPLPQLANFPANTEAGYMSTWVELSGAPVRMDRDWVRDSAGDAFTAPAALTTQLNAARDRAQATADDAAVKVPKYVSEAVGLARCTSCASTGSVAAPRACTCFLGPRSRCTSRASRSAMRCERRRNGRDSASTCTRICCATRTPRTRSSSAPTFAASRSCLATARSRARCDTRTFPRRGAMPCPVPCKCSVPKRGVFSASETWTPKRSAQAPPPLPASACW